jgi:hypothetical protein
MKRSGTRSVLCCVGGFAAPQAHQAAESYLSSSSYIRWRDGGAERREHGQRGDSNGQ